MTVRTEDLLRAGARVRRKERELRREQAERRALVGQAMREGRFPPTLIARWARVSRTTAYAAGKEEA